MICRFFILLFFLFPSFLKAEMAELPVDLLGLRLPVELVSRHYLLMNQEPVESLLQKHIQHINADIDKAEAHQMAKAIIHVSECLEIDPWILSALIETESSFNRLAISKSGAVGLTQFTSIGIKEVNDQLGLRGKSGAPENVTHYWAGTLRGCVDPDWVDLWDRIDVNRDSPDFYHKQKAVLKNNINLSIAYGAILLKTYLALMSKKDPDSEYMSQLYFLALQSYNGEPGESKVKFAKNVFLHLKNTYPLPVDFPL